MAKYNVGDVLRGSGSNLRTIKLVDEDEQRYGSIYHENCDEIIRYNSFEYVDDSWELVEPEPVDDEEMVVLDPEFTHEVLSFIAMNHPDPDIAHKALDYMRGLSE